MNYSYADYDQHPDPTHRPMYLNHVLSHISDHDKFNTIIDIGCGGGDFSEGLALAGYSVFGIDLNPSGIRAAERRSVGKFCISSVYDSHTEPFNIDSFDVEVCIEVIEHLYDPRKMVKQAYLALRPGGLFLVTTPYWGYLKNLALAITNRTDKALTALWDGGHIKHFSRKTLTSLVTEQGFCEVAFYGCGEGVRRYTPYLWNSMLMVFEKPE